jgi:prepilin peptidase CpaA
MRKPFLLLWQYPRMMISIPQSLTLLLSLLYVTVILWDARRYIIPNGINLLIAIAYPLLFLVGTPDPWWGGLAAFSVMLSVGLIFFFLGIMGGGDVKLLAVSMLWMGWSMTSVQFLMLTALVGGVLAIFLIIIRRTLAPLLAQLSTTRTLPRIFRRGEPIPYGIAIAASFLWLLYGGAIAGLE